MITKEEVVNRLKDAAFGKPLVSNMYRGLVAEIIVQSVLPGEWKWCSADWAGWDFEHIDGCKLEVKQSAALQTWSGEKPAANAVFGIAPSKGFWVGDKWTENPGRQSAIYVFAHHSGSDRVTTDHRDPQQWGFYVVGASDLPDYQTISLSSLTRLSQRIWSGIDARQQFPCSVDRLAGVIELIRATQSKAE